MKPTAAHNAASEPLAETHADAQARAAIDASCRTVVNFWFGSAVMWLVVGSVFALVASIKLHMPYFAADPVWLTFGRVRPAHLNAMIYGWSSMAGIGVLLWLQARLSRVPLPFREALLLFGIYWNIAIAFGLWGILDGRSTGIEWLEMPFYPAAALGAAFVLLFATSLRMLATRKVGHIYVSQWYLFGATLWFPFLFATAMLLMFIVPASGPVRAVANWWFAHNVLGLWLTPVAVAAAYYLIPKVLGRPIHSYYLSILGFWTLALFYNWVGTHHLIGGPMPAWLITVGTVSSLMMFVPVITVAINHHLTMIGHFHRLRQSPTLRFTVFGAMSYTVVSLQGSLTALRSVNRTTHFTHYTIAHAHLGVYAFFTMIMFGSFYYIMPRLCGREWWSARLIRLHFWTTSIGITLYFVALTWGGIGQGIRQNDASVPWLDVVRYVEPFLQARSVAGVLLTVGHLAFGVLVLQMLRGRGPSMGGPTLLLNPQRPMFAWLRRSGVGAQTRGEDAGGAL
jgi:cytochrome c oxidase cbb3-type subunit 1